MHVQDVFRAQALHQGGNTLDVYHHRSGCMRVNGVRVACMHGCPDSFCFWFCPCISLGQCTVHSRLPLDLPGEVYILIILRLAHRGAGMQMLQVDGGRGRRRGSVHLQCVHRRCC